MIVEVIAKINEAITAKIADYPCLNGSILHGIAEPILRHDEGSEEYFPVIVDATGEDTLVFADDDYPMGIYHRLLSKSYSMPPVRKQYGDQTTDVAEVEMMLICWAIRNKVSASVDVLERLIYSAFKSEIKAVSSNFKRTEVFNGEFTGIPFFLPENVMLFSMKYSFKYPAQQRECIEILNFYK